MRDKWGNDGPGGLPEVNSGCIFGIIFIVLAFTCCVCLV